MPLKVLDIFLEKSDIYTTERENTKKTEDTKMKNRAREYRLQETTTPENLAESWSCTLNFGNRVLLAGYYYNGMNKPCYFGAVYEYTTADHSCEGTIKIAAVSEVEFEDNGHAIAWAMQQ